MADITVSADIHSFLQAANATAARAVLSAATLGANTFTALQTITQASANAGILASTGYSLTGSDATSMVNLAGAWNTSGTPSAIRLNITDTASNAASLLMDLQVGGVTQVSIDKYGSILAPRFRKGGTSGAGIMCDANGSFLGICSNNALVAYLAGLTFALDAGTVFGWAATAASDGTMSLALVKKAAATLQLGEDANGVTHQMFTAASRITSDGVGANLTIAGGNGRGGAGGSLIFSTYTTAAAATIGTLTTRLTLDTAGLLTFADAVDMAFNTTTGTKIGTATGQKIGFWGATPVIQPTSFTAANASHGTLAGTDLISNANLTSALDSLGTAINEIRTRLAAIGITA